MAMNAAGWTSNIGNMSHQEVSARVIDSMPRDTFTSVKTASEDHFYVGTGDLASRKIVLQRSSISCAIEVIKCFFMTLFFPDAANRRGYGEVGNDNALLNFVIGEDTAEDNVKEVKTAFINCRTVTIFISEDGGHTDIEVRDSKAIVTARMCGKLLRQVPAVAVRVVPEVVKMVAPGFLPV